MRNGPSPHPVGWGLAVLLLLALPPTQAESDLPRVASINLCADQLLLKLADPDQIASVTRFSRNPRTSFMASAARRYPVNRGHAEEVMVHEPDLVLVGQYTRRETVNRLRAVGYRVVELPVPKSLTQVRHQLRRAARLLGHPRRGERLVARLDRTLAEVGKRVSTSPSLSALVLRPNGVTSGEGSLLDSLIRAAGLRNAARQADVGVYGELPLERVVELEPDLLILGNFHPDRPSLAQGVLSHSIFNAMTFERSPIRLPGRLWSCGGWFVGRAVERLAEHAYGIRVPEPVGKRTHDGG